MTILGTLLMAFGLVLLVFSVVMAFAMGAVNSVGGKRMLGLVPVSLVMIFVAAKLI
jgi:hypothetical protein